MNNVTLRAARPTIIAGVALLCVLAVAGAHAKTNRVFFIGNSVTDTVRYDNLRQLAESRGHRMPWGRQMTPGAPLDMLINTDGAFTQPPYGPPTNALPYYDWDCISLQPFDRSIDSDTNSISRFIALALPRNTNAQIYVYSRWMRTGNMLPDYDATWTTNAGSGSGGYNQECKEFFEKVMLALRPLWLTNLSKPIRIVPCGDVLYAMNQKMKAGQVPGLSSIVQVYADGIHLNDTGAYIVACTFFATMFKESPVGLPGSPYGINDAALAAIIQTTVWEVVRVHPYAGVIPEPLPDTYNVSVPEGGTAVLRVKMSDPIATTLTVSRNSGDADISVSNGATLVFTPANHAVWQAVTLAAGEDGDWAHGAARIQCAGAGVATTAVTAVEKDNDAAAVCYEGFDVMPRPLHGLNTGYGWNGGWSEQNSKTNQPGYEVAATGLTFGNLVTKGRGAVGGLAYETAGRALDVATSFAAWATNMGGTFYIGRDATELWVSWLVRVANAANPGMLQLGDSGFAFSNPGRLRVQNGGGFWRLALMSDSIVATSSVAVVANTTYLMVARIQFGNVTDQVDLFVNPALTGAAPVVADATAAVSTNLFRFSQLSWYPHNSVNQGWLDEIRFGNGFANVTPTIANVFTNNNSIPVNGVVESDQRSGYTMVYTGLISGTGVFVEATGLSNIFVGTISPGFSAGALVFDQATGSFVFGTSATPLTLQIENGDLLAFTNLAAPLALNNLDVTFLSPSTYYETNWFLTCASGISGELHATNFVMYTSGRIFYDTVNGRVGVWIIPEPASLALLCAGGAWLRRRSTRATARR